MVGICIDPSVGVHHKATNRTLADGAPTLWLNEGRLHPAYELKLIRNQPRQHYLGI